MKKSRLEGLEVYNFSRNNIGSQLLRAIDSVGANISEGYGRGSKIDNARFVKIARGSLFETKYWLNISNKRKLLTNADLNEISNKIKNLLPRLSAYINYLSSSSRKNDN